MLWLYFEFSRQLSRFRFVVWKELVQRRMQCANRYRQSVHRLEDALEVLALKLEQAREPAFVHPLRFFDFFLSASARPAQLFNFLRRGGSAEFAFKYRQLALK